MVSWCTLKTRPSSVPPLHIDQWPHIYTCSGRKASEPLVLSRPFRTSVSSISACWSVSCLLHYIPRPLWSFFSLLQTLEQRPGIDHIMVLNDFLWPHYKRNRVNSQELQFPLLFGAFVLSVFDENWMLLWFRFLVECVVSAKKKSLQLFHNEE